MTEAGNSGTAENERERAAEAVAAANAAFGTVMSILLQSEAHQLLHVQDLKWLVVPAVALQQFRILRVDGMPVGYVSWALVTEEVDARLSKGQPRLSPHEWNSGDIPWLVDCVLPQGIGPTLLRRFAESFELAPRLKVLPGPGRPDGGVLADLIAAA